MKKSVKYLPIVLIIFVVLFSISFNIYSSMYQTFSNDNEQHYYEMIKHFKDKTFPYLGARLTTSGKLINESKSAQVPGGFFYIYYSALYKIAGENVYIAVTLQTVIFLITLAFFLFYIYQNFGFISAIILSAFMGINSVFIQAVTSFSNPGQVLLLSILLFIFFSEYIKDKKQSKIFCNINFSYNSNNGPISFCFILFYSTNCNNLFAF